MLRTVEIGFEHLKLTLNKPTLLIPVNQSMTSEMFLNSIVSQYRSNKEFPIIDLDIELESMMEYMKPLPFKDTNVFIDGDVDQPVFAFVSWTG